MNLNQFIQNNRAAFEQDGPPAHLWLRIADQLPDETPGQDLPDSTLAGQDPAAQPLPPALTTPKLDEEHSFRAVHRGNSWTNGRTRIRWRWAASIALLLLAGGFEWFNSRYGLTAQPEVVAISPSYAKEVTHYASLINDKQAQLHQLTESNPDLYRRFSGDLKSLETSYNTLKADLPQTPNQDVLIQAMIQNLQLQIDLLNEQLRVSRRLQTTITNELPAKPI